MFVCKRYKFQNLSICTLGKKIEIHFFFPGSNPSLKDPTNGYKEGRVNQNFTLMADVGDNYDKDTCQWFVPNPVQNGLSLITLNMGT